ncbi:MAG TPA: hypothetical protein VHY35_10635 [Stellaceae bacterium]|jgi:hypothetical protein|nr:hypothetical protein [Stellaceae bacterium]
MAITTPSSETDSAMKVDDYQVAGHVGEITRPATHHMLSFVHAVLIILLAAVSFGLFWVVMTIFGVV